MARKVRRGELPMPDDDDLADRYERIDAALRGQGYDWYEVSNWARPGHGCRHNLAYWRGSDWWGIGPGAHSHVGGVRWWDLRYPTRYSARLLNDESPAEAREMRTKPSRAATDFDDIQIVATKRAQPVQNDLSLTA